jgi:glucosamine-6-phosphate deaminase
MTARLVAVERIRTVVFERHSDLAVHVAERIAAIIRERNAGGARAVLGLATGSTPIGVYRELIRMHREEGLSFRNVVTFNLDEYWPMPPESTHSYHRFMWENFFAHVDIERTAVHIPSGAAPREETDAMCAAYEAAIRDAGGIDFQLLGIGKTGHIGFNEPGSGAGSRTRLVHLDNVTRRDAAADFFGEEFVPTEAVTMGIATILEAREIAILATGEHKSYIVRRAVEGEPSVEVAETLLQGDPHASCYADEAAETDLTRIPKPWLCDACGDADLLRAVVGCRERRARRSSSSLRRLRRAKPVAGGAVRSPGEATALCSTRWREDPRRSAAARPARPLLLAAPGRRRDLDGRHPQKADAQRERWWWRT